MKKFIVTGTTTSQEYVDFLRNAIQRDLLTPLGLKVPKAIPIKSAPQEYLTYDLGGGPQGRGVTLYNYLTDKNEAVYISEAMTMLEMAATQAHEMIHASLPGGVGHNEPFPKYLRALGMIGPAETSEPGAKFREWFRSRVDYSKHPLAAEMTAEDAAQDRRLWARYPDKFPELRELVA